MAKGKVNKSFKAWVSFVKSVQKKYKLNYKDAIHKAKELKDSGVDWMKKGLKMKGGDEPEEVEIDEEIIEEEPVGREGDDDEEGLEGGRRRRRRRTHKRRNSARRSRSRGRSRTFKRSMSRRRSASRNASLSMGVA